ncbi:MAG: hypothetical protein AB7I59_18835 [Geminicoccaceae bacterium]
MSALLCEINPAVGSRPPADGLRARLALVAGGLAPWLLLVGLQGVLHRAAVACLAGPFPT